MKKILWIAWEKQRRSTTLAHRLNADLHQIESNAPRLIRYMNLSIKTVAIIFKGNYETIFVQNPSIVLSFLVVLINAVLKRWTVIIDSHTPILSLHGISSRLFNFLSDFIYARANLVIVTNQYLKRSFEKMHPQGTYFVLPDQIPTFQSVNKKPLPAPLNILLICTYAPDEPYEGAFKAMQALPEAILYVTGNWKKATPEALKLKPDNVNLTGFLPENEYIELLHSVDIVMDLTSIENCMVCGAYEAIAAGKPLILSKTKILTEYFNEGVVHCSNQSENIKNAILQASKNIDFYKTGISRLHDRKKNEWYNQFRQLCKQVGLDIR